MSNNRVLTILIGLWALLGAGLAIYTAGNTNRDSLWIVIAAALIGVAAALGSAALAYRGKYRVAGALLIVSVIIPSAMAYIPNVVALLGGLALVFLAPKPGERRR
ncbi:MAG: hypothetical protein WC184_01375 [Acidimicrobiia bacterium]